MSNDRDQLKSLLLSEEIAQIEAIQKLLNDQKRFTEKIAGVLDSATDLVIQNNPKFQKKFSKIDSKAYVRAIKANKQTFIDALLPIIGPMIRKSVTNAIRKFVADVNRAMELGFSYQSIKWRWQAFTKGVPFAELVFNNTIAYQVQQIFLIDNNSGLLIEYAGQEAALLQDKEAMSAMLTAIQDFVKDSLDNQSEGLSAAELGDRLVWVIQGNIANIAVVVKGAPTHRLRDMLSAVAEELHADYSHELKNQNKWNNNPELKLQLEQLLITKTQSEDQNSSKKIRIWPWLVILLGIVAWLAWSSYQNNKTYQTHLNQLSHTPGFTLLKLTESKGNYIAEGLQDPNADLSQFDSAIQFQSTAFISLDDEMVAARVNAYLQNPAIKVKVNKGTVTLSGEDTPTADSANKLINLPLIAGVMVVDNQLQSPELRDIATELSLFLQDYPLPQYMTVSIKDDVIVLTGDAQHQIGENYIDVMQAKFNATNTTALKLHASNDLIEHINQTFISMTQPTVIANNQLVDVDSLVKRFKLLLSHNAAFKLTIKAQSDCQGSVIESNNNIANRAKTIIELLVNKGLTHDQLLIENHVCEAVSTVIDANKLGVGFEVTE